MKYDGFIRNGSEGNIFILSWFVKEDFYVD